MAEKKGKKKQDTAYRKEVNAEFRKGAENVFTGGGSAAYQPRDADTKKPGHGSTGKRQAEKVTQAHQETFGQKVQKWNGVLNVLGKGQKTKHPAQPIAKLNVPDARRVLPKGLPCFYLTIRQGILHEKLFQKPKHLMRKK